jgi:hypothetical protein
MVATWYLKCPSGLQPITKYANTLAARGMKGLAQNSYITVSLAEFLATTNGSYSEPT